MGPGDCVAGPKSHSSPPPLSPKRLLVLCFLQFQKCIGYFLDADIFLKWHEGELNWNICLRKEWIYQEGGLVEEGGLTPSAHRASLGTFLLLTLFLSLYCYQTWSNAKYPQQQFSQKLTTPFRRQVVTHSPHTNTQKIPNALQNNILFICLSFYTFYLSHPEDEYFFLGLMQYCPRSNYNII